MKIATILIVIVGPLVILGCEDRPAPTVSVSTPTQTAPSPRPIDLGTEARNVAEKEWGKVWIQNGDTSIAKANDPYHPYLLQIKGRRVDLRPEPLSDADRLNEMQWKGSVAFHCVAARKFGFNSNEQFSFGSAFDSHANHHAGWNEWFTPDEESALYEFKKQHGNWILLKKKMYKFADMVRPAEADLRRSQP